MQLLPDLRHSWLVQEITLDVVEACVEAGISQLCPRANAVTSEVVARATAAGLSIRCWGVKDVAVRHLCYFPHSCVSSFMVRNISCMAVTHACIVFLPRVVISQKCPMNRGLQHIIT